MPARGGFCPSRSFSAAFSLSNLLFRREPFQNCQQRTKGSKIVNGELNAQKASTLNKMLKMCKKVTFMYADCDGVGKPKSMLNHNIVL